MTVEPGTRLGSYEILGPLGAGSMGEVYRARDARLQREVAVKVLPRAFANDAESLLRFEREARAVAALSHPNILAIHDFGREDGTAYAVTELLEGETLRERLAHGALPRKKAIDIGIQLAQGLSAAHEKGIVHRDLKPDNVFVTRDGRVKILDFGLAKQQEKGPMDSRSPTTIASTEPGTVLGTAAYMAPEQVRGLDADHRADIFAFGCVLYEMLAGHRAFQKDTAAETMTAILNEEPPPLPSGVSSLAAIVDGMLEKSRAERIQSARDVALFLQALGSSSSEERVLASGPRAKGRRTARRLLAPLAAFLAGVALVKLTAKEAARSLPVVRALTFSGSDVSPAVSPDGRTIAFASVRDGRPRIWLKQLASAGEAALTTCDDTLPRFSPDGSQILFLRIEGPQLALYRQDLIGGEPRRVLPDVMGADWAPDGRTIVFLRYAGTPSAPVTVLSAVSLDGGAPRELARTALALSQPRVSPDGRTVVAPQIAQGGAPAALFVVGMDGKNPRVVPTGGFGSLSSPAFIGNDEVLYSKALSAAGSVTGSEARFFRQRLSSGAPVAFLWSALNSRVVDVLGEGRIVFDTAVPRENLRELALGGGAGASPRWLTHGSSNDRQPSYSRDGKWVLFSSNRSGNLDLWEVSLENGAVRRVTDDAAEDWDPGFTPDGTKILWSSNRSGAFEVWAAEADGSGARQISKDGVDAENPTATPDGWVVYSSAGAQSGLWKVRLDGTQATRIVAGFNMLTPEVSPDGRWVTYVQNGANARNLVHVVSVEDGRPAPFAIDVSISTAATFTFTSVYGRARWRADGKALYYLGRDDRGSRGIYEQEFAPGKDTSATRRALLGFDADPMTESFAISPDGKRITIAAFDGVYCLMVAENLDGVSRPIRSTR